jgi:hypothetical protein
LKSQNLGTFLNKYFKILLIPSLCKNHTGNTSPTSTTLSSEQHFSERGREGNIWEKNKNQLLKTNHLAPVLLGQNQKIDYPLSPGIWQFFGSFKSCTISGMYVSSRVLACTRPWVWVSVKKFKKEDKEKKRKEWRKEGRKEYCFCYLLLALDFGIFRKEFTGNEK